MHHVKLAIVIETLNNLKDKRDEIRLLIADQVRDNEIEEATENLERLKELDNSIQTMENLKVVMPS
ncbi:hypothetical protein MHB73_21315 [Bacillus sp. FSL K6-6483]